MRNTPPRGPKKFCTNIFMSLSRRACQIKRTPCCSCVSLNRAISLPGARSVVNSAKQFNINSVPHRMRFVSVYAPTTEGRNVSRKPLLLSTRNTAPHQNNEQIQIRNHKFHVTGLTKFWEQWVVGAFSRVRPFCAKSKLEMNLKLVPKTTESVLAHQRQPGFANNSGERRCAEWNETLTAAWSTHRVLSVRFPSAPSGRGFHLLVGEYSAVSGESWNWNWWMCSVRYLSDMALCNAIYRFRLLS